MKLLTLLGIQAIGWDPAFFPTTALRKADVVNLGFVVNVIEDPRERAATLRQAFTFASQLLIVSARMMWDRQPSTGTNHADGIVTTRGTFQKFFTQEECRKWIDRTLGTRSIAAAPGVFYVFRQESTAQAYLAQRFLRGTATPQVHVSEHLFQQYRGDLDPLIQFYSEHGRVPSPAEYQPWAAELITMFGSLKRAFRIIQNATPPDSWRLAKLERQRSLLVFAALSEFDRRPRFGDFPIALQHDIRALFGSYKNLCVEARRLLFCAGQPPARNVGFEASAVGKLTRSALYVHASALAQLPPVLRIYEGCAKKLTGLVEGANLIKLHRDKAIVSYLTYPRFDRDPHPALAQSLIVDLQRLDIHQREYHKSSNPPVLHRKETFVAPDYRLFKCFRRLTRQEERLGLLDSTASIGTRVEWLSLLQDRGFSLSGHRVTPQ